MIKSGIVLLLLSCPIQGLGRPPQPQLMWTRTLQDSGDVVGTAWSPTASCVAVATPTTVHVIDRTGEHLWEWNFHNTNRLIRVGPFSIAVSPTCDAVLLTGGVEYKYVWAGDRHGRRTFFKTAGTPLAAKFDLHGNNVAIVTGAAVGYLLSPHLNVRWSGTLDQLPVRWPSQVVDPRSTRAAEFTKEDVETLFSALLWGYGVSDSVSDDGEWRAVWNVPFRGAGNGSVELWGPKAGGYRRRFERSGDRGQPRWTKAMGCSYGELTADGRFVIVTGDPDHPQAAQIGDSPACDAGDLSTYVFDREGNTVLTWGHDQERDELPAAVLARTGQHLELRESVAWDVPLTPDEAASPNPDRSLTYSPGRKFLLVVQDHELRLYKAPE
jgi:hypothetical protein